MCPLNQDLKRLAVEAQQFPRYSRERQVALTKLINAIQRSGKLCYPYRGQFQGFYNEIYAEALQRLFVHICERIDDYDSTREVLQWTNFLLQRRFFIEASRELFPTLPKGIDPRTIKRKTLDELDKSNPQIVNPQQIPLLSQEVIDCLQEDPEGIFKSTHVVNYPDVSFQFVAQKIVAGYSWKEISEAVGISISTLSSFYQRCLVKFAPKFREYLSH